MSIQKLLYVFTQAPYSNSSGLEGLDATLIGAAFEQHVSVLFVYDGVFLLKDKQTPAASIKQFTKTFKVLEDFGVDNVYVDSLSLSARGLSQEQLICDTNAIDVSRVKRLIAKQDKVFTF